MRSESGSVVGGNFYCDNREAGLTTKETVGGGGGGCVQCLPKKKHFNISYVQYLQRNASGLRSDQEHTAPTHQLCVTEERVRV